MKYYENIYYKINKFNLNNIIINDIEAWKKYRDFHHIYNKIWIAESQNIPCGPMGLYPENYPIIFKPIINLFGMSRSFKIIKDKKEYDKYLQDGLFWMDYLSGIHYCIDIILLNGKIKFYSCLQSFPYTEGTFKYHESIPEYQLPEHIIIWVEKHFQNYTGCVNIELIDNKIIEAHLRLNGDYYLYNDDFTKELDKLYNKSEWNLEYKIEKKYLIPVFINKTANLSNIDNQCIFDILNNYKCDNIHFDNIDSNYQKETLSRYLMFDCNHLENGLKAKDDILDIINL